MTNLLTRSLTALTVLLLFGLVLIPSLQIVARGLGVPFVGAEELTRFLLICLVFAGFPLVVATGENIVMAEFKAALPDGVRRAVDIAIALAAVAVSLFVAYVTWTTAFKYLNNATPTLKIPFWLFLSATFVGFAGAAGVHLRHLVRPPRPEAAGAADATP
ncbi:TRAP transporter small permease [Azospirillum sp. ST 5-10]|uniref:TRAP transporter small permease n=1 Tax=unclassified Azospirillum TaxID=2630922 RepID=UPI003F49BAA8